MLCLARMLARCASLLLLILLTIPTGCAAEDADAEPACACTELTASCPCLNGKRLVRLATVRVVPNGAQAASEQLVLVAAPSELLAFEVTGAAAKFDLWLEGQPEGGLTNLHHGELRRAPAAGWLNVANSSSDTPFTLSVHAVVAADDASFANEGWMKTAADAIADIPLSELCLVGSHDANTSGINPLSNWGNDWSADLKGLNPKTAVRASRAQEQTLAQQLLHGVRYVDLRFDLDEDDALRSTHGLRGEYAETVIGDIASFVQSHPEEILLVDIQAVYGPPGSDGRFAMVVALVDEVLGSYMASPSSPAVTTPQELWDAGKPVVVLLNGAPEDLYADYPLWKRDEVLASPWGNKQQVEALGVFLDAELAKRPLDKFFVLQGQLTPDESMAITWGIRPESATVQAPCAEDTIDIGLCAFARQATPAVHQWLTEDWTSEHVNIVMVDYPALAPLVQACIGRNGGN